MMKEKEKFDEIIRQKLEGIDSNPPALMWDKIEAGINTGTTSKIGILSKKLFYRISAALVFLTVVSSLVYLNFKDDRLKTDSKQDINLTINNDNKISIAAPESTLKTKISENKVVDVQKEVEKQKEVTEKQVISNPNIIQKNSKSNPSNAYKISLKSNKNNSKTSSNTGLVQTDKTSTKNEVVISTETLTEDYSNAKVETPIETPVEIVNELTLKENNSKSIVTDSTSNPQQLEQANPIFRYNPNNLNKYFIGFQYGPEFIFNTNNINPAQNLNFTISYQNVNFWMQSGIGLKYSVEEANYVLKYTKYEYDRTQFEVDSLILAWNNVTQQAEVQTAFGHFVNLYKNKPYSYNSTAKDVYYNIRVPVLVGYRKDFKKAAYFFSGGVSFNLQLSKHTQGLIELDNNSKLTSLYYPVLTRRKSNLEYLINGGFSYKIMPRVEFTSEIMFRMYQYNLYNKISETAPATWSTGINLGLSYEL